MTTLQNWTDQAGAHTRLIADDGRITEWDDRGMLCREGCGEPAGLGTGGRCDICAGITDPEEDQR